MNDFFSYFKQDTTERGWYNCDFLIVTGRRLCRPPLIQYGDHFPCTQDAGYSASSIRGSAVRHDFLAMGRLQRRQY